MKIICPRCGAEIARSLKALHDSHKYVPWSRQVYSIPEQFHDRQLGDLLGFGISRKAQKIIGRRIFRVLDIRGFREQGHELEFSRRDVFMHPVLEFGNIDGRQRDELHDTSSYDTRASIIEIEEAICAHCEIETCIGGDSGPQ